MPQMKANRIWCFAPNCCPTLMMILHLKRGGRVLKLSKYRSILFWILSCVFRKVRKHHTKEFHNNYNLSIKQMCLWMNYIKLHVNELIPSMQVPPFWQLLASHSLISVPQRSPVNPSKVMNMAIVNERNWQR